MAKQTQGKSGNGKLIAIIAIFVVTIGALAAVIVYLLGRTPESVLVLSTPTPNPNVLVGMSTEEIERRTQEVEENSNKNNIIVSIPTQVVFEDGKSQGRINVVNVRENTVPFTVEYFTDDGVSVLKTGLLAPGYTLEYHKLDVELPKGEYNVSAIHTTYDENGVEIGKVGVAVTFFVRN